MGNHKQTIIYEKELQNIKITKKYKAEHGYHPTPRCNQTPSPHKGLSLLSA